MKRRRLFDPCPDFASRVVHVYTHPCFKPKYTRIDKERLKEIIELNWRRDNWRLPAWNETFIYPKDDVVFLHHLWFHSAMNFCYAWTDEKGEMRRYQGVGADGVLRRGAFGMASRWYAAFGEEIITPQAVLACFEDDEGRFSLDKFADFFQVGEENEMPLLEERMNNVEQAARYLIRKYDSKVSNLLEKADYDVRKIRYFLIRDFPDIYGRDTGYLPVYNATAKKQVHLPCPFYKLANLFPMILYGRLINAQGAGLRPIANPEGLAPVIDYIIPRVFAAPKESCPKWGGALVYPDALKEKIERKEYLVSGAEDEVELRAAAFFLAEKFYCGINEYRRKAALEPVTRAHLDSEWWGGGRGLPNNHHLCLTTNY